MNEESLKKLAMERRLMNRKATRMVIGLSIFIHILLNIYARLGDDEYLKVYVPLMTIASVIAVLIILRLLKDH